MSTTHLVLDIETILDPDLPELSPDPEGKKLPAPLHHKVVCVGGAVLKDYEIVRLSAMYSTGDPSLSPTHVQGDEKDRKPGNPRSEEGMLRELFSYATFEASNSPTVVTWAGRTFDLPVLLSRAFLYGIPVPGYYAGKWGARYRYSDEGHVDVMDQLVDFGAARFAKLDAAARAVGWPGKRWGTDAGYTDGASVASLVAENKWAELAAYCLSDVAQTAAAFLRFELVRGKLSLARYQYVAGVLLGKVAETEGLAELAAAVAQDRFLLKGRG